MVAPILDQTSKTTVFRLSLCIHLFGQGAIGFGQSGVTVAIPDTSPRPVNKPTVIEIIQHCILKRLCHSTNATGILEPAHETHCHPNPIHPVGLHARHTVFQGKLRRVLQRFNGRCSGIGRDCCENVLGYLLQASFKSFGQDWAGIDKVIHL